MCCLSYWFLLRGVKSLVNKGSRTKLLLSTIEPNQKVKKCTVAGWLKSIFGEAGIDTSQFTAHYTRSASTSKVKINGLSIGVILRRGNWSRNSTWRKHYQNFVTTISEMFQDSRGLGSSLWTEKDGVSVCETYGTGTIDWNYEINSPNFLRPRSGHNKTETLRIKLKYSLMLSRRHHTLCYLLKYFLFSL